MSRLRWMVVLSATAVLVGGPATLALPPQPAVAKPAAAFVERSVDGSPVVAAPRVPGAEDAVRQTPRKDVVWPEPGVREHAAMRVETLAPQRVERLGGIGHGVLVHAPGKVPVTLDYSGFASAYGPTFAGRLRMVRLPACVTVKHEGECPLAPELVPAKHDYAKSTLTADVTPAAEGEVYMLAAATGGSYAGNFGATDLMASGSWQAGGSTGAFTYSYPVPEPPSLMGNGPELAFNYSSSTVDGMTSAGNGQSGWTGIGWTLSPGFIERHYKPCADDAAGTGKRADQRNWGHLCWESPDENDGQSTTTDPTNSVLTISLEGRSTQIVKDRATGVYRTEEESGWTIQYVTGGASGQPYWLITTQGGTVYRFGYRRDSMWQVPFAGDDAGEPCRDRYNSGGSTYPGMCQGPWRWNVDQITDADENLTTLYWKREAWKYRWYASEMCCTEPPSYQYTSIDYDRGGYLDYIEWGANTTVAGSRPTSKLVFNMVSRCATTTARDDPAANPYPVDSGTGNLTCLFNDWDVPGDLVPCDTYNCPATGPAFYIMRRLDSIVSHAWDPVAGVWEDVHKLQLRFKYIQSPANGQEGCCTPALWLDYIRPIGVAGTGEVRLPPVDFDAVELNGRVDWGPNWRFTKPKAILPRIGTVHNGYGGRVEVTYGRPNPCPDGGTNGSGYSAWLSAKQWDRADQDCFQVYDFWFPFGGGPEVFHGIYHKYVVTKVVQRDQVGGSPEVVSSYEYLGRPAWARPVDYLGTTITVTAPGGQQNIETATWSEARGYETVRTLKGSGTDPAGYTVDSMTYFRGMYDDVYANGTAKGVRVTDFDGNAVDDRRWLAGRELQERTWRMTAYSTDPAARQYAEIESTRHEYQLAVVGDGPGVLDPSLVNRVRTRGRDIRHDGSWRYTDERITYDGNGMPIRRLDDATCTTISYVSVVLPVTTEERAGADCVNGTLIGKTTSAYDADGNVTETRTWTSASASSVVRKGYDDYGRQVTYTDELGRVTATAHNPAVNWPYNGVTVTGPTGLKTTTISSPIHGSAVKVSDVDNNLATQAEYDHLGRTKSVRNADGVITQTFDYAIPYDGAIGQPTGAARVTSNQLQSGTTWITSHAYDDGWGRARESQVASPAGGRIVTATTYDSRGLESAEGMPVHNASAAGAGLLNAAPATLPSWVRQTYDGAERQAAISQHAQASELRRNTISYMGAEGYTVTPPTGGNTEYWQDSEGRTVRVVEWAYWGQPYETRFEYDIDGNLTKITDARGNVRTYTYDWAGRRLLATDPDTGTTTYGYDAAGNLLWTVNALGQKVSHTYDELGRMIGTWAGEAGTGTRLAAWTFDTVAKGHPASATSYHGGNAYTEEVLEYDTDLRPKRTRITIPAAEGALAGSYEFTAAYDRSGRQTEAGLPAVGAAGLAAEKVTTTYTALGYPSTLTGNQIYVSGTSYSNTGRPTERRYGASGNVRRTMTWDTATNRLTNLATWVGTAKKQDDDYYYDAVDNVARIVDKTQATPQSECFQYDLRNRLAFAWTTIKPDCSGGWYSSHDWLGTDPYLHLYEYDSVGNITKKDTGGRPGTYVYAPNRNGVTAIQWPDRTDSYAYDATGNMTSRTVAGQTTTFAWDALGRLANDVYAADGSRLIRREAGRTTVYMGPLELELAGGVVSARTYYAHGDGATVAVRTSSGVSWLLGDEQGSEQLAINSTTSAVSRQRYLPFGARRGGRDDITETQRGFLGKIEDDSTGLVHLGARFYDPTIGKFISPDPVVDLRMPEWANPYAYAGNNPESRMDPTGLASCSNPRQCDHMEEQERKKKKPKAKKPKPKPKPKPKRTCWNPRQCDHQDEQRKAAKHQAEIKKCGGTVRACQAKDDARYHKKVCYNKASCEHYERKWVKPKTPKATCGDKCEKESSCIGNKDCKPATPPVCPYNILQCQLGTNRTGPKPEVEEEPNPLFAGGCPRMGGVVISCASGPKGGSNPSGGSGGKDDKPWLAPQGPGSVGDDVQRMLRGQKRGFGDTQSKTTTPHDWGVKPPDHPWGRGTTESSRRTGKWSWATGTWDDFLRFFGLGG